MNGFDPHRDYWSTLTYVPSEDLTPLAFSRRVLPLSVHFNTFLRVSTDIETRTMLYEIALLNILELQPALERMGSFESIEWSEAYSVYIVKWDVRGMKYHEKLPYIGVLSSIESHLRNKEKNEIETDGVSA
jgi:hypothetical protein